MFHSFEMLVAAIACGIGFIGAGLGMILTKTRSGRINSLIASAVVALVGSLSISIRAASAQLIAGLAIGLLIVAVWLWQTETVRRCRRLIFRPAVAGFVLAFAGVGLIAAGSWRFDEIERGQTDEQLAHMQKIIGWHPTLEPATIECTTDLGTPILLQTATMRPLDVVANDEREILTGFDWNKRIIPRSPASDESNCHGWVFTGGKYWVLGRDVPTILKENGYKMTRFPRPGDVAIYSKTDGSGAVDHTGIVRAVGTVTMVESKWGWMGVYLHAADASCYGTNISYYHTSRSGHQFTALKPDDAKPLSNKNIRTWASRRPTENR